MVLCLHHWSCQRAILRLRECRGSCLHSERFRCGRQGWLSHGCHMVVVEKAAAEGKPKPPFGQGRSMVTTLRTSSKPIFEAAVRIVLSKCVYRVFLAGDQVQMRFLFASAWSEMLSSQYRPQLCSLKRSSLFRHYPDRNRSVSRGISNHTQCIRHERQQWNRSVAQSPAAALLRGQFGGGQSAHACPNLSYGCVVPLFDRQFLTVYS
jgi:hypothetical protein